ncbi:class I SAM-dependent DNA methyltransferase [Streptomyces sp. BBFR102]|uniref:class I SAM-dependent DNA methyltransferase n=1 Tax=Streptomyces sp. BBFR102 TaxID=3448171 RepID=UPI003F536CC7
MTDTSETVEPLGPAEAATRASYDTVAADYERLLRAELDGRPLERALLTTFAALVRGPGTRPVADLGCGPGRITAHLAALGVDAYGIDLSPGMVAVARRRCPHLRFEEGTMAALAEADGALGGAVAWYSTVHTPPEQLPGVFAEVHRVLAPGGRLLLAYKAGERVRHLDRAYGHPLSLDVYWVPPGEVAGLLGAAGFTVEALLIRRPDADDGPRAGDQGFVLARKAEPGAGAVSEYRAWGAPAYAPTRAAAPARPWSAVMER